ncbi:hypothetical protein CPB86DRAFT_802735 [Serendipita vermifera]|nr:hypothetical protein CPB86DRAFT_802735 [Serendipita vermifera]
MVAAGNDGGAGMQYASGPISGIDVIAGASVDNTVIPVQYIQVIAYPTSATTLSWFVETITYSFRQINKLVNAAEGARITPIYNNRENPNRFTLNISHRARRKGDENGGTYSQVPIVGGPMTYEYSPHHCESSASAKGYSGYSTFVNAFANTIIIPNGRNLILSRVKNCYEAPIVFNATTVRELCSMLGP